MNQVKHSRIGLLGLVVSALAVYFVGSHMNVDQFYAALRSANYGFVGLSVAFMLAGLFVRAVRWNFLLSGKLNWLRAVNIVNVTYLVNGLLPLRLGEVARAYLATRVSPPIPVPLSISTIIIERLLDMLAVMALLGIAVSSAGVLPDEIRTAAILLTPMVLIGFLVLIFLATKRELAQRLTDGISKRIPLLQRLNISALVMQFLDGLMPLTRPTALLGALGWTAFSWFLSVLAGAALMVAFYEKPDFATTCLFIAAASLAIAVPAVPGNIGTYELSILMALGAMGYDNSSSQAVAFAVVVHGLNLFIFAGAGFQGIIAEGISLDQLSQGVRQMQGTTNQVSG